jgi:hypothetical protein
VTTLCPEAKIQGGRFADERSVRALGGFAVTDNVETRFGPSRVRTHSGDCWKWHAECAYLLGWADCEADDAAVQAAIEAWPAAANPPAPVPEGQR